MVSDYDPNYVPTKAYFIVGCKALISNPQGKILILKRSDKTSSGGKWGLPGGALDEGENPYEGIKREIEEEAQIGVAELKPYYLKSSLNKEGDSVIIIGFTGKAESEEVKLNWEHEQFKWLTREEALNLDLTPDARSFLEAIQP